jgi:hypothetical protein
VKIEDLVLLDKKTTILFGWWGKQLVYLGETRVRRGLGGVICLPMDQFGPFEPPPVPPSDRGFSTLVVRKGKIRGLENPRIHACVEVWGLP